MTKFCTVIDYPASPTKKAYVGINKQPFIRAAKGGYGYQGVLLQDSARKFIQCHSCGGWFMFLSWSHLKKCCKIKPSEYKKRYGLNVSDTLVSDQMSLKLTKVCLGKKKFMAARWSSSNPPPGNRGYSHARKTSYFNKYESCPLQLKARLCEFIKRNRSLPHGQGKRGGGNLRSVLQKHYGTLSAACKSFGLPFLKRRIGSKFFFQFPDGTVHSYCSVRFGEREAFYEKMIRKIPLLRQKL